MEIPCIANKNPVDWCNEGMKKSIGWIKDEAKEDAIIPITYRWWKSYCCRKPWN